MNKVYLSYRDDDEAAACLAYWIRLCERTSRPDQLRAIATRIRNIQNWRHQYKERIKILSSGEDITKEVVTGAVNARNMVLDANIPEPFSECHKEMC